MSYWTHITGTIVVYPLGRTQAEKRYILETVLDHLPLVTGSERDMNIHIVQKSGFTSSSSCDEFGMRTNNLKDSYGDHSYRRGWLEVQDEYVLVVEGDFRDRMYKDTYREFIKWLSRLAKRVEVCKVLVEIESDDEGSHIIYNDSSNKNSFYRLYDSPSWSPLGKKDDPNWCEYLMWRYNDLVSEE